MATRPSRRSTAATFMLDLRRRKAAVMSSRVVEGCGGRREGKGEMKGKMRGGVASYGEKERRGRGERGRGQREKAC